MEIVPYAGRKGMWGNGFKAPVIFELYIWLKRVVSLTPLTDLHPGLPHPGPIE
jgi:hypothetical protein